MSFELPEVLAHIKTEVDYLLRRSQGIDRERFLADEDLQRAFARSLGIIGEAAKRVPDEFRQRHEEIDWRGMSRMRDRLIHDPIATAARRSNEPGRAAGPLPEPGRLPCVLCCSAMGPVADSQQRIIEILRNCTDVLTAYLFGSAASGRRRRDSDIDVAVIFEQTLVPEERFRLRCELSERIASASGAELADVIDLEVAPPLLAHQILRTGRLLFSRDERRRVTVSARQVMRYIDTKRIRRILDDATFRRLREGSFGRLA